MFNYRISISNIKIPKGYLIIKYKKHMNSYVYSSTVICDIPAGSIKDYIYRRVKPIADSFIVDKFVR